MVVTLVVRIKLPQAFDLVNIGILVEKLRFIGFLDGARRWISSFLSDPSQVVSLSDGGVSQPVNRHSEVPQGSVLGPAFSIFINYVPCVLEKL